MARALIVGLGEVGSALYEIASRVRGLELYGYDTDATKSKHRLDDIPKPIDYIHITIPYTSEFVDIVGEYISRFSPRIVFVHSTVAPGTTRRIFEKFGVATVYTPVRGKHPNLRKHMLFWTKWIAVLPYNEGVVEEAKTHLESMGMRVRVVDDVEGLELAKLWETAYRAILIAAWQEIHRIAKSFGARLRTIAEFVAEVHRVLKDRPVYYPDVIGGHCLIPNINILRSVYESKLLDFVLDSNTRRASEVGDPAIRREIDEVRDIYLNLTDRSYFEDP